MLPLGSIRFFMSAMAEVLRSPLAARAMFGGRPKGDAVTLTARQTRSEVRSTEQVVTNPPFFHECDG
jgi:hypothetical protein